LRVAIWLAPWLRPVITLRVETENRLNGLLMDSINRWKRLAGRGVDLNHRAEATVLK
jgi:hypothetical protein